MSGTRQTKTPLHDIQQFFKEFWGLFKEFYEVSGDESYWESVVYESSELIDRYKKKDFADFAEEIVLAMNKYLEKRYREGQ